MIPDLVLTLHVAIGALAMLWYWQALGSIKGTDRHRRAGRRFMVALLATVLTVAPLTMFGGKTFDPGRWVAFFYLAVCVVTLTTVAWTAVRWKDAPERFRALHFRVLGPVITVLGVLVLVAGSVKADPVATVLSWVGLVNGPLMIWFAWSTAPLHPQWWKVWHVNAVCVLSTAVHGTLLFVVWRWVFSPEATRVEAAACHVVVLLGALMLRAWWGRKLRLPWGFFAAQPAVAATRSA